MTSWPQLPHETWGDTIATLHRWTQIVGKIRLACTPWINHSWHVPSYVTARGLSTSLIPHGQSAFQIDFDFEEHRLEISTADGGRGSLALESTPCADFYAAVMAKLDSLGVGVEISPMPCEIEDPVPFDEDRGNGPYDPDAAHALWRALIQSERVFQEFRSRYIGKCSPIHVFWGGLDMAVTRFSGRRAPPHPGGFPHLADWITREAYSHEVSSLGFWPGNADASLPLFYAYAYPSPAGFAEAIVRPDAAFWYDDLGEFVLPYDAVRQSDDPDAALLDFAESTYVAAADLAGWDREVLEAPVGFPRSY
jgi:hypothetical protein